MMHRAQKYIGLCMLAVSVLIGLQRALAQVTTGLSGFIRPLRPAAKVDLPPVNLPKAEWSKIADLQDSDGTAELPLCSDPSVIYFAYESIMAVMNMKAGSVTNYSFQMVTALRIEPVWAHETISGGQVCSMEVAAVLSGSPEPLAKERWVFQTFARDGKGMIFFADTQPNNY